MRRNYNTNASYEIVGRILNGVSVTDYVLHDRFTDEKCKMSKNIVDKMALENKIYNCYAQIYNGIVSIKGINCKISRLPKYDSDCKIIEDKIIKVQSEKKEANIIITGKIKKGKEVTEYIVAYQDEPDKTMRIPKDMTIQLAIDGKILNARVQMSNGKAILRSTYKDSLKNVITYNIK